MSSGVTKGAVGGRLVDASRSSIRCGASDPPEFWDGYRLRLLDAEGQTVGESDGGAVSIAASGRLELDRPLAAKPQAGQAYELVRGEEAPVVAIRYLLGLPLGSSRSRRSLCGWARRAARTPCITRRGAQTALVTTRGFGDVLQIGYQNRPRLFDLAISKPQPLFAAVVEIDERIDAAGRSARAARRRRDPPAACASCKRRGDIESLAICLLHAYRQPQHEQLVGRARPRGRLRGDQRSSRVAPLIKIVSRGDTTVVDAYLNPVLRDVRARLAGSRWPAASCGS